MIVDVLRNDLGRVCRPGSVRVPRLCRLERTAAVQHLVSTVTGGLAAGPRRVRPARGVVPGRLDHRRPEDPGDGDPRGARAGPARPVHRRARLDRAGRRDADEHPDPDVRRRRPAADPPRRRRDHLDRATRRPSGTRPSPRRAARSARSAGSRSRERCPPRRAGHVWVDGRLLPADGAAPVGVRPRLPARRRHLRDAARPRRPARPSWPSTSPGCAGRRTASTSPLPDDLDAPARDRDRRRCSPPRASTARTATPRSGSRSRAGRSAARGLLPPDEVVRADDRDPGLAGRAAAGGPSRARPAPRRLGRPARPGRTRWPRSRPRRAPTTSTPGSRRAGPAPTTRCS